MSFFGVCGGSISINIFGYLCYNLDLEAIFGWAMIVIIVAKGII